MNKIENHTALRLQPTVDVMQDRRQQTRRTCSDNIESLCLRLPDRYDTKLVARKI